MAQNDYGEKLRHPLWQKKRLRIFDRDKFECQICGDNTVELHVHHKRYANGSDPWDVDDSWLITLCRECHALTEGMKDLIKEVITDVFCGMGKPDLITVTQVSVRLIRIIGIAGASLLESEESVNAFDRALKSATK